MGLDLAGLNIDIGAIDAISLDSLLGAPDVLGDSPALADTEGLLSALDGNLNLPEAENLTAPDVTAPVAGTVVPAVATGGGELPELGDITGDGLIPADTTAATPAALPEVPQETETAAEKGKRTRRKAAAVEEVKAANIEAAASAPSLADQMENAKQAAYLGMAPGFASMVPSSFPLPVSFNCQLSTAEQYGKLMKYAGQLILGEA